MSREIGEPWPTTQNSKSPTLVSNMVNQPCFPIPAVQIIPKLSNPANLQSRLSLWLFDLASIYSAYRQRFFLLSSLKHLWSSHYFLPNQSTHHRTLNIFFKCFGSITELCFQSRICHGLILYDHRLPTVNSEPPLESISWTSSHMNQVESTTLYPSILVSWLLQCRPSRGHRLGV